ncbi:MAG: hypothetical protein OEU26_25505 [Candidatus Tectomicrobia bacterium]|nr:hypothetical protein [Candidatus Tectomicrobia bacterium]
MKSKKSVKGAHSVKLRRENKHGLQIDHKVFGAVNQFAQSILKSVPGEHCLDTDVYHALRHILGISRSDTSTDLREVWKLCQELLCQHHPGLVINDRTGLINDFQLTVPLYIEPPEERRGSAPKSALQPIDDADFDVDELIDYLFA